MTKTMKKAYTTFQDGMRSVAIAYEAQEMTLQEAEEAMDKRFEEFKEMVYLAKKYGVLTDKDIMHDLVTTVVMKASYELEEWIDQLEIR